MFSRLALKWGNGFEHGNATTEARCTLIKLYFGWHFLAERRATMYIKRFFVCGDKKRARSELAGHCVRLQSKNHVIHDVYCHLGFPPIHSATWKLWSMFKVLLFNVLDNISEFPCKKLHHGLQNLWRRSYILSFCWNDKDKLPPFGPFFSLPI